jgi:hypothetical protein
LWAGEAFAESISFDDMCFDMDARIYEECTYVAHRYRPSVDEANRFFGRRGERKLQATPQDFNNDGDERVTRIGRGTTLDTADEFVEKCDLWEVWVPVHNVLLTFRSNAGGAPEGEDDLLQSQEYIGPESGPYTIFNLNPIPDQLLGKGPISDLVPMDVAINAMARKLIRQAVRQKQIDLYKGQAEEDAKRIRMASDGDITQSDHPDAFRPWVSNPPSPHLWALLQGFQTVFNRLAGNLDTLGGLARQASTASQEEQMNQNASATVAQLSEKVVICTGEVMEKLAWYWWHDPIGVMRGTYKLDNDPNAGFNRELHPMGATDEMGQEMEMTRDLPWEDMDLQVDPYSLVMDTPQARLSFINGLVNQMIPIMPLLQQMGVEFDAQAWVRKIGQYSNQPDVEEILKLSDPNPLKPEEADTPGMAQTSERTYTRKSENNSTPEGEASDAMQQMMGAGGVEAGSYGGTGEWR